MTDTAQPGMAAENVQLDDAANAFKVHLGQVEAPAPARDQQGRFAAQAEEPSEDEEIAEEGAEALEPADDDEVHDETEEAAEEAQPEAVPPPASWSKDDAELWSSLPADAQAKIAEREAQRDAAVGQKFQEAANVKRANEALIAEANTNRARYAEAVDQVLTLIQPTKPDPKNYFTEQGFDQASYAIAQHDYEQMSELVAGLGQQRQSLAAQQAREADEAEANALAEINRAAAPRFAADEPALTDPAKAGPIVDSVIRYAIEQGIPADVFSPENMRRVTLSELHLAWKAQQYDKLKAAQTKVKTTPAPAPKPSPAVKAGVSTPRVAADRARLSGAMDRLGKSGSVEDGAAVLKQLFKGR